MHFLGHQKHVALNEPSGISGHQRLQHNLRFVQGDFHYILTNNMLLYSLMTTADGYLRLPLFKFLPAHRRLCCSMLKKEIALNEL